MGERVAESVLGLHVGVNSRHLSHCHMVSHGPKCEYDARRAIRGNVCHTVTYISLPYLYKIRPLYKCGAFTYDNVAMPVQYGFPGVT